MSKLRQVELYLVKNPFLFDEFTEEDNRRRRLLLSSVVDQESCNHEGSRITVSEVTFLT